MKSQMVWWAGALFLLSLAGGCNPPAKDPAVPGNGGGEAITPAQDGKTPDAQPPKQSAQDEQTAKAAQKLLTEPIAPKEAFVIKPIGAGSYKPSGEEGRLASLGQKIDKAIAQLPSTMVEGRITYSTDEGELFGKTEIKVKNPDTFRVEYNLPKNKADRSILLGDGKTFAEQTPEGWKPKKKEGGAATEAEVGAWAMEFPGMMFEPLTDSKKVWGPLFASWAQKGAKVEEKTETIKGKKATIYRVLLKDKDNQMEVVLDGRMMVPLTIRSDVARKGGGRNQMMWTGRWSFGGTHEPRSFLIPLAKK